MRITERGGESGQCNAYAGTLQRYSLTRTAVLRKHLRKVSQPMCESSHALQLLTGFKPT
jgi:hypothetical protein